LTGRSGKYIFFLGEEQGRREARPLLALRRANETLQYAFDSAVIKLIAYDSYVSGHPRETLNWVKISKKIKEVCEWYIRCCKFNGGFTSNNPFGTMGVEAYPWRGGHGLFSCLGSLLLPKTKHLQQTNEQHEAEDAELTEGLTDEESEQNE